MSDANLEIPDLIPAMTLRGVVLLPSSMLPLRIFESRYRQMLEDVLSSDRMFAVVCEREDVTEEEIPKELPHEVATIGLVRISKKHDDGTSFVLLQGIHRILIKSIVQEVPYRILETERLDTVVEDSFSATRENLVKVLKRNAELGGLVTKEILEMLLPLDDPCTLVDLTVHHLCRETMLKQRMLEETSLQKRTERLIEQLRLENERLLSLKESFGGFEEDEVDVN